MVFALQPRPDQCDLDAIGIVWFVNRAWVVSPGVGLKGCSRGRPERLSVVRPPCEAVI